MAKIHETSLRELHPTQLTIGLIEVGDKKRHLVALKAAQLREFLQAHPMPAVLGPGGKTFITDHHHLARAAFDAGIATAFFSVEEDFSALADEAFWKKMDKNLWVHPLDENGVRHHYSAIPDSVGKLRDDPYRSLAGYVRDAGGYDKTDTAFAEFVWADFFRRSIPVEDVRADFHAAVATALPLARSRLAKGIPGFKS